MAIPGNEIRGKIFDAVIPRSNPPATTIRNEDHLSFHEYRSQAKRCLNNDVTD